MDSQDALNPVPPASSPPAIPSKEQALKSLATGGSGDGSIFQQLTSNPFFTAGFGLAGLGAALRIGQQGLRRGGELLKRRMLVDLEITRHDESYPWVLNWMTRQYQRSLSETAENMYVEWLSIIEYCW
jgi:chaperone BCS1